MPPKAALLLLALLLSACANTADDYGTSLVSAVVGVSNYVDAKTAFSTRLQLPFNAGVKGDVQEHQLIIERENDYALTVRLHFEEGGPAGQRVIRFAGTPPGSPPRPGPSIPVHVQIGQVQGTFLTSVLDATAPAHALDGYGNGFYGVGVGTVHLTPGLYQMSVEALQDIPALNDIRITVNVGPLPRG